MRYPVTTPQQLLSEYLSSIDERSESSLSLTKGALKGLELEEGASGRPHRLEIAWILRAHIGTIDKLKELLPRDRLPSSLELLSAARNLFENIVWLRLFEEDHEWGARFYGIFLEENIDDISGLIKKVEAEISLFERAEEEDEQIGNDMLACVVEARRSQSDPGPIIAEYELRKEALDRRIRRSFTLYAEASKLNGYAYQAHLLKERDVPRYLDRKRELEGLREEFQRWAGGETRATKLSRMIKWRQAAEVVGMEGQYDYLYRLSSRLLHGGPMNIATEKQLSAGEQKVLLEFMAVTVEDAFDLIDRFTFPGRLQIAYVEVE